MLVAGVDSSTQSTKVVLCRAEDGAVVGRGSAAHPAGTECDPAAWLTALQRAGDGLLSRAAAVGVAGQQHGMIVVDEDGKVIRAAWLTALQRAGDGLLSRAAAVGVAGQQHGMIVVDEDGKVIRAALLWNDLRSAQAAADLVNDDHA